MRHIFIASTAAMLALGTATSATSEEIPHRDDFVMNSIGGGEYRDYVMSYLADNEAFRAPMRTLGTMHNTMHQLMTELGVHAREERGDEHVPDFGDRMSGGDWTDYREALEEGGEDRAWKDFVHVVEVMHDRVHHPMYKSVLYDYTLMGRELDLADYVREPEDASETELIPDRTTLDAAWIDLEAFRDLAWEHEADELNWRRVMQNAVLFGHITEQQTEQWVEFAQDQHTGACQPQVAGRLTDAVWDEYVAQVRGCDDDGWRRLVLTHDLARLRVHQVLAHIADFHAGN